MQVFHRRHDDVPGIAGQVENYFRHGIEVRKGAVVFDVGANIGIFSLSVHHRCKGDVDIYAFEPVPVTFDLLKRNMERLGSPRVRSFCCGLSRLKRTATIAYFPKVPGLATVYHDDIKEEYDQFRAAMFVNLEHATPRTRWMRWFPTTLRARMLERRLADAFRHETLACELTTLSEIVRTETVQRIDLLKIDVEKAELDVLEGIDSGDWGKIRQIVIELHDLNGRLDAVKRILTARMFSRISVDQEPVLKGSNIFNVYALR